MTTTWEGRTLTADDETYAYIDKLERAVRRLQRDLHFADSHRGPIGCPSGGHYSVWECPSERCRTLRDLVPPGPAGDEKVTVSQVMPITLIRDMEHAECISNFGGEFESERWGQHRHEWLRP